MADLLPNPPAGLFCSGQSTSLARCHTRHPLAGMGGAGFGVGPPAAEKPRAGVKGGQNKSLTDAPENTAQRLQGLGATSPSTKAM